MKRLFDIVVSAVLLVVLAPVLVAIALLVRFYLGGPVLFRQARPACTASRSRWSSFAP